MHALNHFAGLIVLGLAISPFLPQDTSYDLTGAANCNRRVVQHMCETTTGIGDCGLFDTAKAGSGLQTALEGPELNCVDQSPSVPGGVSCKPWTLYVPNLSCTQITL